MATLTFLLLTLTSFFLLWALEPFYICLTIEHMDSPFGFQPYIGLQNGHLENVFRSKTGRKEIGGFISHNLTIRIEEIKGATPFR